MSTADVALARMAFALARKPTAEELAVQLGISATMREVIADPFKNPTDQPASPKVTVQGAANVKEPFENRSGWREPSPLASPLPKGSFIEGVVNRMCDAALGPAVPRTGNLGSLAVPSAVGEAASGNVVKRRKV